MRLTRFLKDRLINSTINNNIGNQTPHSTKRNILIYAELKKDIELLLLINKVRVILE